MGFFERLTSWVVKAAPPVEPVMPYRTQRQQEMLDQLKGWLPDTNIQAFLRVIRAGETREDRDDAYQWLYGSTKAKPILFESFADHPRIAKVSPWGNTSAAGAYQAMCAIPGKTRVDTWGDFCRAVGPMDFTPMSQDLFAVWCINRRGAIRDVIAGDLLVALEKVKQEWASMPTSTYGQPRMSLNRAAIVFKQYGGVMRA